MKRIATTMHVMLWILLVSAPIALALHWRHQKTLAQDNFSAEAKCSKKECRLIVRGASPLSYVLHSGKIGSAFRYTKTDIKGEGETVIPAKKIPCRKGISGSYKRIFLRCEFTGQSIDVKTSMKTNWSINVPELRGM